MRSDNVTKATSHLDGDTNETGENLGEQINALVNSPLGNGLFTILRSDGSIVQAESSTSPSGRESWIVTVTAKGERKYILARLYGPPDFMARVVGYIATRVSFHDGQLYYAEDGQ